MKTFLLAIVGMAICLLPSFSVATQVANYPSVFQAEPTAKPAWVIDAPPALAGARCANGVCSPRAAIPNPVAPMMSPSIVTNNNQVWERSYATFPSEPLPVLANQPMLPRRVQLVPPAGPPVFYKSVPTDLARPRSIRNRANARRFWRRGWR